MIRYETLLDAARQHFRAVANSPSYTRGTRNLARELERQAAEELASYNSGQPVRELIDLYRSAPEPLRAVG